jgi:HD-GYP domain-containing protein (c-di-GMP phosphodiesterase class II)
MMVDQQSSGVRLAELIASLSLATDLGLGQPQEHILRQTVIATRIAEAADFPAHEIAATYYVSLLALVGCVADSHELGRWFGDDNAVRSASYAIDRAGMPMLRFLMSSVGTGEPATSRLSLLRRFALGGMREVAAGMYAQCQATGVIAGRLGLNAEVTRALPQALERWDGKGGPKHLKGDQIERSMRAVHIANESEVFLRLGGREAVIDMLRHRRGTQFDPHLVDIAIANANELFEGIAAIDAWTTVIDACAPLDLEMTEVQLQQALETLADYADLKSPWFTGHSRAVSVLAAEAGRRAQLTEAQVQLLERAGLVCRLGAIGVSAATWDKPEALTRGEQEHVRTVPYLTERMFSRQARRRSARWPRCSMSGWTAPATPEARMARRFRRPRGYWPRPRSTRRCLNRGLTDRHVMRRRRLRFCATRLPPATSTAPPRKPLWERPAIGLGDGRQTLRI